MKCKERNSKDTVAREVKKKRPKSKIRKLEYIIQDCRQNAQQNRIVSKLQDRCGGLHSQTDYTVQVKAKKYRIAYIPRPLRQKL